MREPLDLSPRALEQVHELAERSGRAPSAVVEEAVGAYWYSLVGDAEECTACPFKKRLSDAEADVVLRQLDATHFRLEEPFRFAKAGGPEILVPANDVTDLASVPGFLTWLVPRYGRHTLPALLHDSLVTEGMDPDAREDADELFRDAMGAARVPFVRRWTIWAAVSVATMFTRPAAWKLLTGAWVVGHALAGVELFLRLVLWRDSVLAPVPTLAVLLSPLVLSLVWGRRYRMGLVSAYNLFVLPVPMAAVLATLAVYLAAEMGARAYIRARYGRGARVNPVRLEKL